MEEEAGEEVEEEEVGGEEPELGGSEEKPESVAGEPGERLTLRRESSLLEPRRTGEKIKYKYEYVNQ